MDWRTAEKLKGMGNSAPKELRKNIVRREDTFKHYREAIRETAMRKGTSAKKRDALLKYIDKPEFHIKREVVNERVTKKLNEYYDHKIKSAIERGEIKKPELDNQARRFIKRAK